MATTVIVFERVPGECLKERCLTSIRDIWPKVSIYLLPYIFVHVVSGVTIEYPATEKGTLTLLLIGVKFFLRKWLRVNPCYASNLLIGLLFQIFPKRVATRQCVLCVKSFNWVTFSNFS